MYSTKVYYYLNRTSKPSTVWQKCIRKQASPESRHARKYATKVQQKLSK